MFITILINSLQALKWCHKFALHKGNWCKMEVLSNRTDEVIMSLNKFKFVLRCVFTQTRTIRKGCECRKNCKVQHSYFRLQKFAKHARGFARNFTLFLKFPPNSKRLPQTTDEPQRMIGELLEPKIRMLDFAIIFDIRILCESFAFLWKHTSISWSYCKFLEVAMARVILRVFTVGQLTPYLNYPTSEHITKHSRASPDKKSAYNSVSKGTIKYSQLCLSRIRIITQSLQKGL